jgi:hypothetical protein
VRWFFAWLLVGLLGVTGLLAAFATPIALAGLALAGVGAAFLLPRSDTAVGLAGLGSGAAVVLLYVGYLNRDGPGEICHGHLAVGHGEISCTQEWTPWPFFALGAAGIAGGAIMSRRAFKARRNKRQSFEAVRAQISPERPTANAPNPHCRAK